MASFLACGNIMSDIIKKADGTQVGPNPGGPAFFALEGIRTYSKDCALVCQAGADFDDSYGVWMKENGVSRDHVRIATEHSTVHYLNYPEEGNGKYEWHSVYGDQNLGYLKTTPEHIDMASEGTRGIYLAQNMDRVFWKKLLEIKGRRGFSMMWEVEAHFEQDSLQRIKEITTDIEMWSINLNEASVLFGIPREHEEDIIAQIVKIPADMCFFRVGARGSWVISRNSAEFCEVVDVGCTVDPTGCGNCSTGAAMYAWVSGFDPAMTGILANTAAGYNAAQYGVFPLFSDQIMLDARRLADERYHVLKKEAAEG